MFIQQIYTGCLAQASYYIDCNGEAAIIDPIREPEPYIKLANERGAKIKYVFETHFHADFVSGHLDLSDKTNAVIVFGPNARPAYPAFIAKHNEKFLLGNCSIKVLHTPGHTVESSCFLLLDEHDHEKAVFTGDTLFIGDVGRPDLMSGNKSKTELGSMLFDSLNEEIKTLRDDVIVYPGHGKGSACGKKLGDEKYSTIGEQKKMNYALQPMSRAEFIKAVTDDLPSPPAYFFKDASINIIGCKSIETIIKENCKPISLTEFQGYVKNNVLVLDTREANLFSQGFIPGAMNIGLKGDFAPWVGNLIDCERELILVTSEGDELETITRLARIGYENIKGYLEGGFNTWQNSGLPIDSIDTVEANEFCMLKDHAGYIAVDVRKNSETEAEKIDGVIQMPLSELPKHIHEFDKDKKYILFCKGGYRSMMAASIFKINGICNLKNVDGGIEKIKTCSPELIHA